MTTSLVRRHDQNVSSAAALEYHWGYPDRVLPCTSGPPLCDYLEQVYWMHDMAMRYTFVFWAIVGAIIVIWTALHFLAPKRREISPADFEDEAQILNRSQSTMYRCSRAMKASLRRNLLPEGLPKFLGHVTRLQLVILGLLLLYMLIFSLVSIMYRAIMTPVKNDPGVYSTRTGLGGFSNRVGALAYALTPLTVGLASRDSLLTVLTGVSYQHFNFLHRWCGRIIFVQGWVHSVGWIIVEGRLYQPQPKVWNTFSKQRYIIWGFVATGLLTLLFVFSLRSVIKKTGYEFFRITHIILSMVFVGACWGHWDLLSCWMIAALAVFLMDRGMRILRMMLIHVGYISSGGFGFETAHATLKYFDDPEARVVRLDFNHNHDPWKPGQHFFLCFPELSIWQSHPFTVTSVPDEHPKQPHHTYIVRCLNGETSKLGRLAERLSSTTKTTDVILTGPYGSPVLSDAPNILAIAGGTGISFALPVIHDAMRDQSRKHGLLRLVWVIRRARDVEWVARELEALKQTASQNSSKLDIRIVVTREFPDDALPTESDGELMVEKLVGLPQTSAEQQNHVHDQSKTKPTLKVHETSSPSPSLSPSQSPSVTFPNPHPLTTTTYLGTHHPCMQDIVQDYINNIKEHRIGGNIQVLCSGPKGMSRDVREAVARANEAGKVWKGVEAGDVAFYGDERGG